MNSADDGENGVTIFFEMARDLLMFLDVQAIASLIHAISSWIGI